MPYSQVKAFPSAEGFGANTVGGRGGRIVRVTTLADSGAGSLRDALSVQTGARYVVFDVSGTITLTSGPIFIDLPNSNVTIAGQTSPGGVQVKGDGIFVHNGAHDVIMRHMRLRPGPHYDGSGNLIGHDSNAFIAYAQNNVPVYNIILDHCDFMWATDQNGPDAFHATHAMTAQYSLIAEGTNRGHTSNAGEGGAPGGDHNFGLLMSDPNPAGDIQYSFHHNLIANVGGRAPLVGRVGVVDIRNNIVYNTGGNGGMSWGSYMNIDSEYPCVDIGASAFGNFVGNLYLAGPLDQRPYFSIQNGGPVRLHGNTPDRGGTKIYTSTNWGPYCPSGCANDWDNFYWNLDYYTGSQSPQGACAPVSDPMPDGNLQATEAQFRVSTPYAVPVVTTESPGTLLSTLLPHVGASKPFRDSADTKIVNDVLNNTGDPQGVGAGGPWPTLTGGAPPTDTDGDGMPDAWEVAHGLNPTNASDGPATAANRYTNVENYLNELAGDTLTLSVSGAYHVSTSGNDSNSCQAATNVTFARRTIQAGVQCLGAGDTLYIHAGTSDESLSSGAVRYPAGTGWEQPVTIAGAH